MNDDDRRELLRVAELRFYGAGMSACLMLIAGIVGVMIALASQQLGWLWLWWLAIIPWLFAAVMLLNGVLSWREGSRAFKDHENAIRARPDVDD